MAIGDDSAIVCARIMRAFDSLLGAAMARLRLHYAARIGALWLVARVDQSAAMAALTNERDTALNQLRQTILADRRAALQAARRRARQKRYRVGSSPAKPGACLGPARPGGRHPPDRAMTDHSP
jgi:hypothetical protein